MDEDKSLFLYLPNNVASHRYVSNTLSHFKIPLAKPLNFCDPHYWEVGLSELYFPSSYYNISQDNNSNLTIQYHMKGVVHMSCICKTACFLANYAPHSLQAGRKMSIVLEWSGSLGMKSGLKPWTQASANQRPSRH